MKSPLTSVYLIGLPLPTFQLHAHLRNEIDVVVCFKPGNKMRMMYYSGSDTDIERKRKSEPSQLESNLHPSDYLFGCFITELQETRF